MLDYGKKIQVGNFEVLKFTRSLSSKELKRLRNNEGIPKEIQKRLQRGGVPFIKVTTISGSWGIEFSDGTAVFRYIDEADDLDSLRNIFTMFFADTTTFGDREYWEDKGNALHAYMDRLRAKDISKEDDDKILKDEEDYMKDTKTVEEMAEHLKKEVDNG